MCFENIPDAFLWLPGKSGSNGNSWLPLWVHLEDTAGVMNLLIQKWVPEAVYEQIGREVDLTPLCRFLALVHDIGKATPAFANKILPAIPDLRSRLAREIPIPRNMQDPEKSTHALAGEAILRYWNCPEGIAAVVGAHHGKPQEEGDYEEDNNHLCHINICVYPTNYYGTGGQGSPSKGLWMEMRYAWIVYALTNAGYSSADELPDISVPVQFLLTGLLIVADWLASNDTYFPQIPLDQNGESIDFDERISRAWDRIALPDAWTSCLTVMDDDCFKDRFGFCPNTVQRALMARAESDSVPGLYILEAPMGCGKTEAALSSAEIIAGRFGNGGVFFGLPTQATANGIFPRLKSWAEAQSDGTIHAIRLAHGMAEMNDEYRELFKGTARTAEDAGEESLIVHEWFSGRKQALLADFVIGTVDQLLMAGLRQKHAMLRHLGLAGKVVVIDECHAYDAYMNRYLDRTLAWLGAYQTPVILLSATLPGQRRKEMVEAYLGSRLKADEASVIATDMSYPLLTSVCGQAVRQESIPQQSEEKHISVVHLQTDGMLDMMKRVVEAGGCAGVILNTVNAAQQMAEQLRNEIADAEVILFHSRFINPDRAELELELMRRIGKHSTPNTRKRLIIVGTQVLEQSLDIDFDLLITELCPMDLLLQRMGRLQRHHRTRPSAFNDPVCGILAPSKGTQAVYGEWLLMRTSALLPETVVLPRDIPYLVQNAYADITMSERSEPLLKQSWEQYENLLNKKKRRADQYTISKPERDEYGTINSMLDVSAADSEEGGQAAVRDIDPTIQVLLMRISDEGVIGFLPWQNEGCTVPGDRIPSVEESRLIARQRVSLPAVFCIGGSYERTTQELLNIGQKYCAEWQQAPLLKGEYVLLLDEHNSAVLNGYRIIYSREIGLQYEKEDKSKDE